MDETTGDEGLTGDQGRRDALKKIGIGAAGAAALWSAPSVLSVTAAAAETDGGGGGSCTLCNANLLVNGGAESNTGVVAGPNGENVPDLNSGWTVSPPVGTPNAGSTFAAVAYGSPSFQSPPLSPLPPTPGAEGQYYFWGGFTSVSSGTQSVDLRSCATQIDTGSIPYTLEGWLGGYQEQEDSATVTVTFKDGVGGTLGSATIGPVTAADRSNVTSLLYRFSTANVPSGTRSAEVVITSTNDLVDGWNDGYAELVSLKLGC